MITSLAQVREALLKKAEYLAQIGDKEACIEAVRQTTEKTVGLGNRMDLVFLNIRVGLFFTDHSIIKANIAKAHQMLEEGGDWDRRNRLKVYEGLYMMSIRDFTAGSKLFLDGVSTFTSYELTTYIKFVEYTVIISVLALDRSDLHTTRKSSRAARSSRSFTSSPTPRSICSPSTIVSTQTSSRFVQKCVH